MTPQPIVLPPLSSSRPAIGAPVPTGWPLLRLGFRPFYLGAAVFGALAVPLWIALYLGALRTGLAIPPLLWHAHEMLFGFAAAVIIGFLMTAGKAWTGLATPRGATLGVLAGLWLAARFAALVAPYPVYAALDILLLPLVAAVLVRVLLRAGNRRNLPLAGMLLLLALANLLFHLSVSGSISLSPLLPLHAGLALVVLIECVMGGRVIPAFTMSARPGLKLTAEPVLERSVLSVTALALGLWIFVPARPATGLVFALAAALHALRQWHWQPWGTRKRPILWILHAAYAWIALGFGLLALAQNGLIGETAGIHALAVGATGGLIIGMVTRTARGHTGRSLQVTKAEVLAYALVMVAAVLRVLATLVDPGWLRPSLILAAATWGAAFAIYAGVYGPWLLRARADGRDG